MGHRKQQFVKQKTKQTPFFSRFIGLRSTYNHKSHRYFTISWAAAVMLASGQRTSVVSSYQNHASPQPCTAASHWGLVNVSSDVKYTKFRVIWLSQDIVHAFTLKLAIAVYNCTTQKINGYVLGAPPSGWRTKDAPSPGAVRGSPELYYTRSTWVTQGKKMSYEQANNTQKTLQRALGSKKAPEASSPWASSLVKARLTKDSEWGDPWAMESSRRPAPFEKDNLPRQKGRGTSTYVRGCCLLWLSCDFAVT